MGLLTDFDLRHLITDFGCRVLVETGIDKGDATDEAVALDFRQIFAIEPNHKRAIEVALRHAADHRLTVIHGKIERGLAEALDEIAPDSPVLFWLGAHRPGADRKPRLERQMRMIAERRDIGRDIFLIDDLRIFEDGPYDDGPCPAEELPPPDMRSLAFLEALLGGSHELQRSRRRTGYLCAYPRLAGDGAPPC